MNRNFKTSLFILISLFLVIVTTGCSKESKDQYDTIKERGYVIVGLDDTFAPMGFRDKEGNITGFDVDLAKVVFEEMNLDVEFLRIDWMMKETELNNLTIDVIWNGYTITPDREKKVNFSAPYIGNRQVIVVLKDSIVSTKSDLAGVEVGVQDASSSYDALYKEMDIVNRLKNKQATTYATNDLAFLDLESGRIGALVVDEILARYYISLKDEKTGKSEYRILEDDFGIESYGVGFRKNDKTFLEAFNTAFQTIVNEGKAKTISNEWFGEDIIIKSEE